MKTRLFPLLLVPALLLSACDAQPAPTQPAPAQPSTTAPQGNPPANRPQGDRPELPDAPSAEALGGEIHSVVNPASGADLYVAVFYPENWDGQSQLPTLVLVPGGSGNSSSFLRGGAVRSTVGQFNQAGIVAVVFDPDGRGQSTGTEDYDGFIQQDGLAAVIRRAAAWPGIDPARVGLVTFSFGITMGAGTLARYPDLPIRFLIDWEGPANREDTGGCDASHLGHLQDVASCDDEVFWGEREASTFIGDVRVPYQRLQSQSDHVQPDNAHAVLMINTAVNGGVPWVRLNSEMTNQIYAPDALPALFPDSMDRMMDTQIAQYALELFDQQKE
ncbi:MAG: hypothetical protein L3J16_05300 [Anaerolineales bacterium]|nr:hypothetical protein [Anaerolineales bacterium]